MIFICRGFHGKRKIETQNQRKRQILMQHLIPSAVSGRQLLTFPTQRGARQCKRLGLTHAIVSKPQCSVVTLWSPRQHSQPRAQDLLCYCDESHCSASHAISISCLSLCLVIVTFGHVDTVNCSIVVCMPLAIQQSSVHPIPKHSTEPPLAPHYILSRFYRYHSLSLVIYNYNKSSMFILCCTQ